MFLGCQVYVRAEARTFRFSDGVAFLVPDPGGANDVVELGVARLPGQFVDGFFGTGDEDGGGAGAARTEFDGDGMAGDAANGVNDFADAETLAVAEVEDEGAKVAGGCRR